MNETHPELDDNGLPLHPTDILINVIVTFLTPMFLGPANTNIGLAQMAAMETVNSFRIRNQAELIVVAQIIAFAMTTLGSLSLSMADDLALPMILRLRTNATALSRAEHRQRRILAEPPPEHRAEPLQTQPRPEPAETEQTVVPSQAEKAQSPTPQASPLPQAAASAVRQAAPADAARLAGWADAFGQIAQDLPVPPPNLPPAQHKPMGMRAAALPGVATGLLTRSG